MKNATTSKATVQSGRATTPRPNPKTNPKRPVVGVVFNCPMCGGDATITGTGPNREFTCLDCTRFTIATGD
ncbi:hypothetical protein J8F10_06590 [Gemmata sp. G18]|uniref:Uncharacterized protein n=1 Tax=Gemmata palustris TaxID=2822762 RepID=A0ABS5BMJ7_9BACT|nr:hypothetical protein [Gemmata palustris]MBP3954948.1 hypothetical protein [Gemmata palustris]